jgi:hypothetical protein
MALLFVDGFDHYQTADFLRKWSGTETSFQTVSTTLGRRGGGCMIRPYNTFKNLNSTYSSLICGFACYIAEWQGSSVTIPIGLVGFSSGLSNRVWMGASSAGELIIYNASNTQLGRTRPNVIQQGAWAYIEMKAVTGTTTGAVEVRVNGVTELTLTNVNISANTFASIAFTSLSLNVSQSSSGMRIDDVYVCDTSGATNNDFLGDCRVDAYYPTSEGTTQSWTPTPSGTHYTTVDEVPVSTTDYVESVTANAVELFGFNDLVNTPLSIFGVQVNSCARKTDAGARSINNTARVAGANYYGPDLTLSDTTNYRLSVFGTNPATSAAWSKDEINATEFGVRLV